MQFLAVHTYEFIENFNSELHKKKESSFLNDKNIAFEIDTNLRYNIILQRSGRSKTNVLPQSLYLYFFFFFKF